MSPVLLRRRDWAPQVREALNAELARAAALPEEEKRRFYAVFDFDNTCSVFDVEEQLLVHQLRTLAIRIPPEQFFTCMSSLLSASFEPIMRDAADAYAGLWAKYGPFGGEELPQGTLRRVHRDPLWAEFAAKMRLALDRIYNEGESLEASNLWILQLFTGMSWDEVYRMARRSCAIYLRKPSRRVTWQSPEQLPSRCGPVTAQWLSGLSVTENIRELWRAVSQNGLGLWVCSASCAPAICAAIDLFGLRPYVTGVLAMTMKEDADGLFLPEYDYGGCAFYPEADGSWRRGTVPTGTLTACEGKAAAIRNVLVPVYGAGPALCFGDSVGDLAFSTSFPETRLMVCMSSYRIPADTVPANPDERFVRQGRDERGRRRFRASEESIRI